MTVHEIAMVGCGGVSAMHFDGYLAHPERVRIVAACDPLQERREWAQRTYGVEQVFSSLEEMIDGSDWTVAVLCTPTNVRQDMVRTLAAAGKHILVEKPLADSFVEADQIVGACSKAGVQLAVNQNFRDHYGFDIARALIADGRIGEVYGVTHHNFMFRQDRGWRTQVERHAMSVMGVHWFDGFRYMLGREATWVWCRTSSSPEVECTGETDAFTQLLFDHIPVSYVQSFSSRLQRTDTVVLGQLGAVRFGYDSVSLNGKDGSSHWENPYAGRGKPESTYLSLNRLLDALDDGGQPANSGEDNLRTIALLDAAYESARAGEPVTLTGGLLS
ncbi:Gfo/Idh/MocA family protein [Actinopolymorpha alba]|uniref:Gfo/Idh/MocA family protein n=1 Tax=Actinopolymorpha alba TaxID=533267 RepID=UPI0003694C81|nr:Gfo/Idh/MocA family oxidoreductase [Actinopolymorpha alba]